MRIFDTHAHLYFPAFSDADAEVLRCRTAGVSRQLQISCDEISCLAALELASKHEGLSATVGLHPCDVRNIGKKTALHRYKGFENYQIQCQTLPDLIKFFDQKIEADQKGIIRGVGETGFDLHHENTPELLELQRVSFIEHLRLCAKWRKPVVIHNRNTRNEFLDFWRKTLDIRDGKSYFEGVRIRGVVHCFCEDLEYARIVTEQFGLLLGIGGVATYPNASSVRETIQSLPLEYFITETDAPFLPPQSVKEDGIRLNSPAFLPEVIGLMAQIKKMDPEVCAEQLFENAERLFGE